MADTATIPPEAPPDSARRRHRRAGTPTPAVAPPPPPPILLTAEQAAAAISVSRSFFLNLVSSGRAPRGFTLGRCRRWSVSELMVWAAGGCKPRTWDGDKKRGGEAE